MAKDDPHPGAPSSGQHAQDDEAEDRAAILRRRAMFVASAIAGLGLAACSEPQPCLNISIPMEPPADAGAPDADAAADAEPVPCLSVAVPMELDAGASDAGSGTAPADAGTRAQDAGSGAQDAGTDAGAPKPRPRPCLKKAPPRPCLLMYLGDDDD